MSATDPTPQPPINWGRRASDQFTPKEERLTFGKSLDRVVVYLIAGLVAWLCVSTMNLREQMALVVERGTRADKQFDIMHSELERLTNTDKQHDAAINSLKIEAARRGWKGE